MVIPLSFLLNLDFLEGNLVFRNFNAEGSLAIQPTTIIDFLIAECVPQKILVMMLFDY